MLYEAFPPAKAKALWDRFEFVHTPKPKHGSWLNMVEIEINVMVRQCLNRRIADIKTACAARSLPGRRIAIGSMPGSTGKFTTETAPVKFRQLYQSIDAGALGSTAAIRFDAGA